MKTSIVFLIFIAAINAYSNCEEFLSSRLKVMNIGSLNAPKCGAIKETNENKILISMSSKRGRKDLGPTLLLQRDQDEGHIKLTQLLSKDKDTKLSHKYIFYMNSNCTKMERVKYLVGGEQVELNRESCSKIDNELNNESLKIKNLVDSQKITSEMIFSLGSVSRLYSRKKKICDQHFGQKYTESVKNLNTEQVKAKVKTE